MPPPISTRQDVVGTPAAARRPRTAASTTGVRAGRVRSGTTIVTRVFPRASVSAAAPDQRRYRRLDDGALVGDRQALGELDGLAQDGAGGAVHAAVP
jgi:hypothetical protein